MVISLFRHERIRTTKAKAKEVRKTAEKLVTRAKEDSVHNRRIAAKRIHDKAILAKLFTDLGPRYRSRPGGYTRILKLGFREGDGGEVVILELVDRVVKTKKKKPKKEKKAEEK
jgi:large subunit ribosomal protein L17